MCEYEEEEEEVESCILGRETPVDWNIHPL
jgi:hypothetical protein